MIYLLFLNLVFSSAINLKGINLISYYDYASLPPSVQVSNPPFCGDYLTYDLRYVTAVQGLDSFDCGKCLNVTGVRTNRHAYVLTLDQGGQGLDLGQHAFTKIFNTRLVCGTSMRMMGVILRGGRRE